MKINNAYLYTKNNLNAKFIDNPSLEAEILILFVLKLDKKEYILQKDEIDISVKAFKKLKLLIKNRLKGKSIAQIIKNKPFYDLEFYVNDKVLIPRPETELIIDIALEKFNKNKTEIYILDIGTGNGCLAITLAKHLAFSRIDAIDKSNQALKIARINIKKNEIPLKQINLMHKDIFIFKPRIKYDLIVSNPPYIKTEEVKRLKKQKIVADPEISLSGGSDGLMFYYKLAEIALNSLKNNGIMILEHGMGQRYDLLKIFKHEKLSLSYYDDYSNIDRVLVIKNKG